MRRNGPHDERIAVWRALRDELGGEVAAGADAVLDHHRLSQARLQAVREQARRNVHRTASRVRHDQVDGTRRPRLAPRKRRRRAERGGKDEPVHRVYFDSSANASSRFFRIAGSATITSRIAEAIMK